MIMYGDMILKYPEMLDLIPKDIVLMDWIYEPVDHYPTVDVMGPKGFPILVLPGMSNWDRIFPDMSKAMINIRNFARPATGSRNLWARSRRPGATTDRRTCASCCTMAMPMGPR